MKDKLGRIKRGHYKKGPDFYGCFNTGTAPIILRLPANVRDGYVVGPELAVLNEGMYKAVGTRKRIVRCSDKSTVYVYKTRKFAVAKFCGLCEAANQRNAGIAAQHKADLEAAKGGDLEAAARLIDY